MDSRENRLLAALADRLTVMVGHGGELPVPERERRALLLRLARNVAHASERQNAPLATYLIGRFVAVRAADGATEDASLAEVAAVVDELTGASGQDEPEDPRAG